LTSTNRLLIRTKWEHKPLEEERDLASIGIFAGGQILTRLLDLQTSQTRDFFRASAVSLALWMADNWWRLRWEPIADYNLPDADWRLRHELTSAAGGTNWPPLMIYGVGDRVVLAPISVTDFSSGPIEYLRQPVTIIPGSEFESGLDVFFATVLAACVQAKDIAVLASVVAQLARERGDQEIAAWRRLEARLGYDADKAPDNVIERLSKIEERVGVEAVEEAATSNPGPSAPEVLEKVIEASQASDAIVDLEAAMSVTDAGFRSDGVRPIWMVAEDAATRLRTKIGYPTGPLRNRIMGDTLRANWKRIMEATPTARKLPYGARLQNRNSTQNIALQTTKSHDRRFELARVLGDAIWMRQADFGVISRGKTDRQKFQRAFAQSLLCPFEDLRQHINRLAPTSVEIAAAARYYHVHVSVVQNLLINKGILPRETLGEHLEAA
jgi:hypothetical protein